MYRKAMMKLWFSLLLWMAGLQKKLKRWRHTTQDPHKMIMQHMLMPMNFQLVYVCARLGIADHLSYGPRSGAELAEKIGSEADTLYRLLRGLVMLEVLNEGHDGRFGLTSAGERLSTDHPASLRGQVIIEGDLARAWFDLLPAVQSGETPFRRCYGESVFDHFARDPLTAQAFNQNFSGKGMLHSLLAFYLDVENARTIVDVGGGYGDLLKEALKMSPKASGILFDLPHVIEGAVATLEAGNRVQCVAGNFFERVPSGADVYLLKTILHDWSDSQALAILKNCRVSIQEKGRLYIIEKILPERVEQAPEIVRSDLIMLVEVGGRERSEKEFHHLLRSAGFRLIRLLPTPLSLSILEAIPE
jgi:16S RNA G1207 methylase RsmC